MTHLRTVLLTVSFVATCYAGAALLTGFDGDFIVSAVIAVLALGATIWREHVEHERDRAYFERWYWADHNFDHWFLVRDDELDSEEHK